MLLFHLLREGRFTLGWFLRFRTWFSPSCRNGYVDELLNCIFCNLVTFLVLASVTKLLFMSYFPNPVHFYKFVEKQMKAQVWSFPGMEEGRRKKAGDAMVDDYLGILVSACSDRQTDRRLRRETPPNLRHVLLPPQQRIGCQYSEGWEWSVPSWIMWSLVLHVERCLRNNTNCNCVVLNLVNLKLHNGQN